MEMTDMVDTVARALYKADWLGDFDDMTDAGKGRFRDITRAFILELENAGWCVVPVEPTSKMLGDGDSAIPRFEAEANGIRLAGEDGVLLAWTAMLSARPRITGETT